MQIIIKHWTDEIIKSPAKKANALLIENCTGVGKYKGRADQIKNIMELITSENYLDMCRRVRELDSDDSVEGSSNFVRFIKSFENSDAEWIEIVGKALGE